MGAGLGGRGQRCMRSELGPNSSLTLPQALPHPNFPHHLPSTPEARASSRCPTPIFRLVNAGPRTASKQTRPTSSASPDSRTARGCAMTSLLGRSGTEPGPGQAALSGPHHRSGAPSHLCSFPGLVLPARTESITAAKTVGLPALPLPGEPWPPSQQENRGSERLRRDLGLFTDLPAGPRTH